MHYIRVLQLALALVGLARTAHATYSIVAANPETGQVGGAGTSCLAGGNVSIIYAAASGVGVVHAQAWFNQKARDRAVELMSEGKRPADIIELITAGDFDSDFTSRQYAIVNIAGDVAAYTGSDTTPFSSHRHGMAGAFSYSVQGNLLTSSAVIENAMLGFDEPACDLAERLMRGLEAGSQNGEGDSRCIVAHGTPSDSAFLRVEQINSGTLLSLSVSNSGEQNPLPMLREAFAAWRREHPCPQPTSAVGGSETTTRTPATMPTSAPSGSSCFFGVPPSLNAATSDSNRARHSGAFLLLALSTLLLRRRLDGAADRRPPME